MSSFVVGPIGRAPIDRGSGIGQHRAMDEPHARHAPAARHSAWAFTRHLVEMLLAMAIGMTIFGLVDSAVLRAVGLGSLRVQPSVDLVLMSLEMTVPMAAWMAFRGHPRRDTIEMSGSMLVPAALLVALGTVGVLGTMDAEMAYHPIMLVAMVGLMLARRDVYAASHHAHGHQSAGPVAQPA